MRIIFFQAKVCAILLVIALTPLLSFANTEPTTESATDSLFESALKVFMDGTGYYDYLKREITFVSFVRDREQSDVHILVTSQRNAADGREYMIEFIGKGDYTGTADTLSFNTITSDTEDIVREKMAKYIKLGLTRFAAKTDLSEYLQVSFSKPTRPVETKDKWNKWVFEINLDMWASGSKSRRFLWLGTQLEASRVTEKTKIEFGMWGNYNEERLSVDTINTLSITRSKGTNGEFVFSINNNWSYDFEYNYFSSIRSNKDHDIAVEAGLEYNIYPYCESSRKSWIFRANLGLTYMDYVSTTIYDKNSEVLNYTRMRSEIELTQPWGSVDGSISSIIYLHDLSKHRVTISAGAKVRVFEGFSVNMHGNYSRVRDQLSLPKGGATPQQIYLNLREFETSYDYWVSFGVSYSFGAIYNSIVNPRF